MAAEVGPATERQLDSSNRHRGVDPGVLATAVVSNAEGCNSTERMASHPDALRIYQIEQGGTRRVVEPEHLTDHETDVPRLIGIVENRRAAWCATRGEGKGRGGDDIPVGHPGLQHCGILWAAGGKTVREHDEWELRVLSPVLLGVEHQRREYPLGAPGVCPVRRGRSTDVDERLAQRCNSVRRTHRGGAHGRRGAGSSGRKKHQGHNGPNHQTSEPFEPHNSPEVPLPVVSEGTVSPESKSVDSGVRPQTGNDVYGWWPELSP